MAEIVKSVWEMELGNQGKRDGRDVNLRRKELKVNRAQEHRRHRHPF